MYNKHVLFLILNLIFPLNNGIHQNLATLSIDNLQKSTIIFRTSVRHSLSAM